MPDLGLGQSYVLHKYQEGSAGCLVSFPSAGHWWACMGAYGPFCVAEQQRLSISLRLALTSSTSDFDVSAVSYCVC